MKFRNILDRLEEMVVRTGDPNEAVLVVEREIKIAMGVLPEGARKRLKEDAERAGEVFVERYGRERLEPSIRRANRNGELITIPTVKGVRVTPRATEGIERGERYAE